MAPVAPGMFRSLLLSVLAVGFVGCVGNGTENDQERAPLPSATGAKAVTAPADTKAPAPAPTAEPTTAPPDDPTTSVTPVMPAPADEPPTTTTTATTATTTTMATATK